MLVWVKNGTRWRDSSESSWKRSVPKRSMFGVGIRIVKIEISDANSLARMTRIESLQFHILKAMTLCKFCVHANMCRSAERSRLWYRDEEQRHLLCAS